MIIAKRNTFADITVDVDGTEYIDCHFIRCKLRFSARSEFSMTGCRFDGSSWEFAGAAALTMQVLRGLYHGGMKAVVETAMQEIRTSPAVRGATR